MIHPPTPFWATVHPLSLAVPYRPSCALLSYAAPSWVMLHPTHLCCTLLSYDSPLWATLLSIELRWTLRSYTASYWTESPPYELYCTISARFYSTELHCRVLLCSTTPYLAASFWAAMHYSELLVTLWLRCILQKPGMSVYWWSIFGLYTCTPSCLWVMCNIEGWSNRCIKNFRLFCLQYFRNPIHRTDLLTSTTEVLY